MAGHHAYANDFAAYNDCALQSLSPFTFGSEYIKHAENISTKSDITHDSVAFQEFMTDIHEEQTDSQHH